MPLVTTELRHGWGSRPTDLVTRRRIVSLAQIRGDSDGVRECVTESATKGVTRGREWRAVRSGMPRATVGRMKLSQVIHSLDAWSGPVTHLGTQGHLEIGHPDGGRVNVTFTVGDRHVSFAPQTCATPLARTLFVGAFLSAADELVEGRGKYAAR